MTRYQHIKQIMEFFGLDLRSSDVLRGRGFASDGTQNLVQGPTGELIQRYGFKTMADWNLIQIWPYESVDCLGVKKRELVGVAADLSASDGSFVKLGKYAFTVTNSGTEVLFSIFYDEDTAVFRCQISRSGSLILNQSLGSSLSLTSLRTAVNAVSGLSMSSPTVGTNLAEYLDNYDSVTIANGGTLSVDYYSWSVIPWADANNRSWLNPLYQIGGDNYTGVSAALVKGALYVTPSTKKVMTEAGGTTTSSTWIAKYDSQVMMRAGLKPPVYTFTLANGAGTFTDQRGTSARTGTEIFNAYYRFGLKQIDKTGNVVESVTDEPVRVLGTDGSDFIYQFSFASTSIASTGYNNRVARGSNSGAQGPALTFNVTGKTGGASTPELYVGDIAYFYDTGQSRFIQREVTGLTTSTITLSTVSLDSDSTSPNYDAGGNVSILASAVMSANLRLVVWRTRNESNVDGPYYLNEEVPYFESTSYYDEKDEADLGAEYVEPDVGRDEPPVGRYLCALNDQLIVGGLDDNPVAVAFSDNESPEYFTKGVTEFEIDDAVSGVCQTGPVLAVGAERRLYVVSGDLPTFNFRVERRSKAIGVVSHDSMRELQDGLLAFLTHKGPYVLRDGRDLQPLGAKSYPDGSTVSRLEPYFTETYRSDLEKPVFKRAQACVHSGDSLYMLFVPHEDPDLPTFATSNSRLLVFDFGRGTWWPWSQVNAASGLCELDDRLWTASRSYSGSGDDYNSVRTALWRQQRTAGKYNYADHDEATTWRLRSHWESLGDPKQLKRFLRCRIMSDVSRLAASVTMTLKTYINNSVALLSTSNTFDWTTQQDQIIKVKGEKCRSMQFVFEGSGFYEPLPIVGFELEAVASFKEVMKE